VVRGPGTGACFGDPRLVVRDRTTLATRFTAPLGDLFTGTGTPTIADGRIHVLVTGSGTPRTYELRTYDAAGCGQDTCSPTWTHSFQAPPEGTLAGVEDQVAAAGGRLFLSSRHTWVDHRNVTHSTTTLVAFDAATGGVLWSNSVETGTEALALATDGELVYGITRAPEQPPSGGPPPPAPRVLRAWRAACSSGPGVDCSPVWSAALPGAPVAGAPGSQPVPPVVAGGVVYATPEPVGGDHRGGVAAYDSRCSTRLCQPLASMTVDGSPTSVLVASGRLVVAGRAPTGGFLAAFAPPP
jgi:hypothetical protein